MAIVNLSPIGNQQFFLSTGLPNNGGFLQTYAAGTTTPIATYADSAGTIQNPTSIQLGTDGRPPSEIWIVQGTAVKFVLTDSLLNPIADATYDNIVGINDSTASGSALGIALAASSGSSLVGFIQSGTGAVATDLQTRGRLIINVADYLTSTQMASARSATPGTVSSYPDVTTGIQAALTYAETLTSPPEVIVPPGCFGLSSQLRMKKSYRLIGAGLGEETSASTNPSAGNTIFGALASFSGNTMLLIKAATSDQYVYSPEIIGILFDGNAVTTYGVLASSTAYGVFDIASTRMIGSGGGLWLDDSNSTAVASAISMHNYIPRYRYNSTANLSCANSNGLVLMSSTNNDVTLTVGGDINCITVNGDGVLIQGGDGNKFQNIQGGTIPQTVTFSNGSSTLTTGVAPAVGQSILLSTSGTLPTNFSQNTTYYVVSSASTTFTVSATYGGSAIVAGSAGSGTHSVYSAYALALRDGTNNTPARNNVINYVAGSVLADAHSHGNVIDFFETEGNALTIAPGGQIHYTAVDYANAGRFGTPVYQMTNNKCISSSMMFPDGTQATNTKLATTGAGNYIHCISFPHSTTTTGFSFVNIPAEYLWSSGTIIGVDIYYAMSTAVVGNIVWEAQCSSITVGNAMNGSPTADSAGAVAATSSANTLDKISKNFSTAVPFKIGDTVLIAVNRVGNANDTHTGTAYLLGIAVKFQSNGPTNANASINVSPNYITPTPPWSSGNAM